MKKVSNPSIIRRLTEMYVSIFNTQPIGNLTNFTTIACLLIAHNRSVNCKPIFDKLLSLIPQMNVNQLSLITKYLFSKQNDRKLMQAVIQRAFELMSVMEMNADVNLNWRNIVDLFGVFSGLWEDLDPGQIDTELKQNTSSFVFN